MTEPKPDPFDAFRQGLRDAMARDPPLPYTGYDPSIPWTKLAEDADPIADLRAMQAMVSADDVGLAYKRRWEAICQPMTGYARETIPWATEPLERQRDLYRRYLGLGGRRVTRAGHWERTARAHDVTRGYSFMACRRLVWWRYLGRWVRAEFMAGLYGAMPDGGGTHHHERPSAVSPHSFALITGLTS